MSKDPSPNKGQPAAQSGFFADTLGPRPQDQASLGKNSAAPKWSPQVNLERKPAGSPQPAPAASAPAQQRPSAPPPRQPEPEPKKKKGWF